MPSKRGQHNAAAGLRPPLLLRYKSLLVALLRHADFIERCLFSGVTRKTFARDEIFSVWTLNRHGPERGLILSPLAASDLIGQKVRMIFAGRGDQIAMSNESRLSRVENKMNESIDTSKLDPATLANHLGNPEGEIGKAVAANLNKSNAGGYSAALAKLGVNAGDRIIEIGFGNGREIPRVLSLSADATYFGIDISNTMVAHAPDFNPECVPQGLVPVAGG